MKILLILLSAISVTFCDLETLSSTKSPSSPPCDGDDCPPSLTLSTPLDSTTHPQCDDENCQPSLTLSTPIDSTTHPQCDGEICPPSLTLSTPIDSTTHPPCDGDDCPPSLTLSTPIDSTTHPQCDGENCHPSVTLSNGLSLPLVGLGTAGFTDPVLVKSVIDSALGLGYRLLDTADLYNNHRDVAAALEDLMSKYGLDREDIFITTKLRPVDLGYTKCRYAVRRFLEELNTTYIDLLLIHGPDMPPILNMRPSEEQLKVDREETWRCFQEFYSEGIARAVGVSNYEKDQLEEVMAMDGVKPHVNQVHHTPLFQQRSLLEVCGKYGVHLQAYSSLGRNLLNNKLVNEIGGKYGKSAAQTLLKWTIQQGFSVIPKSRRKEHLKQNTELRFKLKKGDMNKLSSLMRVEL